VSHRHILILLLLLQPITVAAGESEWILFLKNPTTDSYNPLIARIEKCKKEDCKCDVKPDSAAVIKLIELIKIQNAFAVDIAFSSLKILDGGDLEDVIRSLGLLTESSPKLLLDYSIKHNIPDYKLEDLLTMLPLETVDDNRAKIETVQKRIKSLSKVNSPPLVEIRGKAIIILGKYLDELRTQP